MKDSATPDNDVLRAEWHDGWPIMNLRTLDFFDSSTSTDSRIFPINALYWPSHSARAEAKSQNRIVILREAKWNRRIYWRTHDGFCNSGQWCPPCRMTRWIADNEFKGPKFCQIHQLPKIFGFSYELSLLTLLFCVKWNVVAESIGEPKKDSATPDNDVLRAEWHDGLHTMNLRTLSFVRFTNFPRYSDFSTNPLY